MKLSNTWSLNIYILCCFSFLLVTACSRHLLPDADGEGFTTADQHASSPKKDNVWVFILAGQSNMAGRGEIEPADTVAHDRILSINSSGELIHAREPLHFYEPRMAGLDCGLSFGRTLIQHLPDSITILLLPTAVGGSSIDQWLGDSVHRDVPLLSNFREKVQIGLREGVIKGILWHQGESDAKPGYISVYTDKLSKLFNIFRDVTRDKSLPVFMGEIGSFPKNRENRMRINDAIHEYASQDRYARVIRTGDLGHKGDESHFDSRAQRTMGERFARAYLNYAVEQR